jgi:hypothetical protein
VAVLAACSTEHVADDAAAPIDVGVPSDTEALDAAANDAARVDAETSDATVLDAPIAIDAASDAPRCASDAACGDAIVDDGFGGTVTVTQTCIASTCVPSPFETCDTTDDDGDGAIDEGCTCVPSIVATRYVGSLPGQAWFGDARILISAWSDLGSLYQLVDTRGVEVRSAMGSGYRAISPVTGGFDALRDATLVHVHDDGTVASEPLVGSATDVATGAPWGTDYVRISAGTRAGPWTVRRFGGTPRALTGETTLTTAGNASFWLGTLTGGDLFWLEMDESGALRGGAIDSSMTVRETAPSTTAWRAATDQLAVTSDRFWLTATDASGAPMLVSIDRTTGAWSGTLPLGPIHVSAPYLGAPITMRVTARSDLLTVSWVDDALLLRARVIDEAGVEHGRTRIALMAAPSGHSSGPTSVGVRIVADVGSSWALVDPCASP